MEGGGGGGSPKRQRLDALEDDIAADEDEDLIETDRHVDGENADEAFSRDYNGNQGLKEEMSAGSANNSSTSDKDIKREKYEH